MSKRTIQGILLYIVISIGSTNLGAGEIRTWTSKSGKSIDAQLIKANIHHVILQDTNGTPIKIQKTLLSERDYNYLDKLYAINELKNVLKENAFELSGKIKRFDHNDILLSDPVRVKTTTIQDPDDKIKRIRPTMIKKKELLPLTRRRGTVVVLNGRRNIDATGSQWSGTVYPCGTKKIKKKKIKHFSVSLKLATQHILSLLEEDEDNAETIRELIAPLRIKKEEPKKPEKIRMK